MATTRIKAERFPDLADEVLYPRLPEHKMAWLAEKGEAPETPVILIGELLVFLVPVATVMLAIGFGLYYAFGGS